MSYQSAAGQSWNQGRLDSLSRPQLQLDQALSRNPTDTQSNFRMVRSSNSRNKFRFIQDGSGLRIQPVSPGANANFIGTSQATASKLGDLSGKSDYTWNGTVGTSSPNNYFQFSLSRSLRFKLSLSQLSANADLQILKANGAEVSRSMRSDRRDEKIQGNLRSGTYFIRVSAKDSANTNYTLKLKGNGSAPDAGNSTYSALDAGNLSRTKRSYQGKVDSRDTSDVYRFTLSENGAVNLGLSKMRGDADLQLLDSSGAEIGRSNNDGQVGESIAKSLNAGTYFARVTAFDGSKAEYTLDLSSGGGSSTSVVTPTPSPTPSSNPGSSSGDPGNSIGSAESQSAAFSRTGQVTSTDQDFYRFSVNQSGVFTANLTGLTGDADVRLIQDKNNNGTIDQGEIVAWAPEWGNTNESIRRFLSSGKYLVEVLGFGNQTINYTVNTNFTPAASDDRKFSIQLNYGDGLSTLNSGVRSAVSEAAKFWEDVVTSSTFNGSHNLAIDVVGVAAPQDWLAAATNKSGTTDATGKWMPTTGTVRLNTSYSSSYNSDPTYLKTLLIHEFAHVLGIGTVWEKQGRSLVSRTSNTYNANTYAGKAYGELLGTYTPTAIPLEAGAMGHWDEAKFGDELLTPYAEGATVKMPLSQVTLASLRDVGWNVNYGAADSFTLSQSILSPAGSPQSTASAYGQAVKPKCKCSYCSGAATALGLDLVGSSFGSSLSTAIGV